jgi:GH15 family glucan-1,4-alpha-glucosidase
VLGLEKAAIMAARVGDTAHAQRWREAAAIIKQAMLAHPKFAMLEDSHFIKRRLASGEVQSALAVIDAKNLPPVCCRPTTRIVISNPTLPKPCPSRLS